jgi:hypothetical protein
MIADNGLALFHISHAMQVTNEGEDRQREDLAILVHEVCTKL